MKNNTELVKNFASFEAESTTPNDNKMINLSGDITFLFNAIRKAQKNSAELEPDYQAIHELGQKYFFAGKYPFPKKGEKLDAVDRVDIVYCKRDHFKTDKALADFVNEVHSLLPKDWHKFVMANLKKEGVKRFGTPAKKAAPAKSTKTAKNTVTEQQQELIDNLVEVLLEKFASWDTIEPKTISKIKSNADKIGVPIATIRKQYEELAEVTEDNEIELDLDF